MSAPGRIGGLRLLRLVVFANSVAIAVLTFLVIVAFALNGDRVDQIQRERERNIRSTCLDVNARHDNTIRQLDDQVARALRSGRVDAGRLRERRDATVLLIDALTPKRDCEALVRQQVQVP